MEVFFTGYCEGSLGKKANAIYHPINEVLSKNIGDYGEGLNLWFLMFVIVSSKIPGHDATERIMYKKKNRSTDMRLNVDYESFKAGSEAERKDLLIRSMLRSVELIGEKKIPNFDFALFKSDVTSIANEQGWIA